MRVATASVTKVSHFYCNKKVDALFADYIPLTPTFSRVWFDVVDDEYEKSEGKKWARQMRMTPTKFN